MTPHDTSIPLALRLVATAITTSFAWYLFRACMREYAKRLSRIHPSHPDRYSKRSVEHATAAAAILLIMLCWLVVICGVWL